MAYKDPLDPRYRASRLKHYYANKEKNLARNKAHKIKVKALVDKLKDIPCTDCEVKYPPYVMHFDHTGSDKFANIAYLRHGGSINRVLEEVKKCELVCSNCHAERTYQRSRRKAQSSLQNYLVGSNT